MDTVVTHLDYFHAIDTFGSHTHFVRVLCSITGLFCNWAEKLFSSVSHMLTWMTEPGLGYAFLPELCSPHLAGLSPMLATP